MQQEIESERLLSEYRAQKKRADELESRNKQLSERLSESEKMLARLQSTDSNSRIAARDSERNFTGAAYRSGDVEQYARDFQSQVNNPSRNSLPSSSTGTPNLPNTGAQQPVWRPITRP